MTLTYGVISRMVSQHATAQGEWCGVPMPFPGLTLDIESRNPWREKVALLEKAMAKPDHSTEDEGNDPDGEPVEIVNEWFSKRLNCRVSIVKNEAGKRWSVFSHHRNGSRLRYLLNTLQASEVWHLETELKAIETLETLIRPHLFEKYALMGAFLETSPKSGLTYIFRRLAPTIVLSPRAEYGKPDRGMRILTALCLHPIGYYRQSHAGAMTPTDDVIAHLLMMRGDEPLFWRRSNQHGPHSPEASLFI